ncbi:MAG: DUF401 family protein [Bacillota bacterium]|nr:DUF401 family protein [Bacillota bacterium]
MTKLLGLGIGFILIITLVIKKKPLALAMAAGTLVAGLGTGLGVEWLVATWGRALIHPDTLLLAMMVGSITLLSWIMAVSKLHERLVYATVKLLHSAKLAVMIIPPMIGALPIPGGAIVSAPLLDRPADMLGMSQPRKAAVNLVFRHASFFFLPFSSSLILASRMLKVDIYHLIRFLAPLGVVTWVVGYLTLVRGAKEARLVEADATAPQEIAAGHDGGNGGGGGLGVVPSAAGPAGNRPRSAGREFLITGAPIFAALAIGFVLPVPFWVGVICGIVLALGLSWRTRRWALGDLLRGIDFKLVSAMFGIMSFREVVVRGEILSQLATVLERSAIPLPVLAFTISLLISIVSANHNTTLGIAYPMIIPLVAPHEVMAYAMLMFAGSFVAYFSSPLHLCQIVTNEHCNVTLPQAFREYVWTLVGVAAAAWGLFYLYLA